MNEPNACHPNFGRFEGGISIGQSPRLLLSPIVNVIGSKSGRREISRITGDYHRKNRQKGKGSNRPIDT